MSWFRRLRSQHNKEESNSYQKFGYSNRHSIADPTRLSPEPQSRYGQHYGVGVSNSSESGYYLTPPRPASCEPPRSYSPSSKRPSLPQQQDTIPDEPPPAYTPEPTTFLQAPSPRPSFNSVYDRPPPAISNFSSPAGNASSCDYAAGSYFCTCHPLAAPLVSVWPEALTNISRGDICMGPDSPLKHVSVIPSAPHTNNTSIIQIVKKRCPDATVLSQAPLYLARYHQPTRSTPTVFGYEISLNALPLDGKTTVALGLACVPYPLFRLPGWHRGSLAIHSDDGRRYCNDGYGGIQFTRPFQQGETLALALVMRVSDSIPGGGVNTEVLFFRNGGRAGGWFVREELEIGRMDPKPGFLGERDVFAAVGVAGGRGTEVAVRIWSRDEAWKIVMGVEAPGEMWTGK